MTTWWIARESTFSLNMFKWVNTIIEYIEVAMKLKGLGMQVIEKKRDESLSVMNQSDKCVKNEKMFTRIKSCD